jgi:hypothetical protein
MPEWAWVWQAWRHLDSGRDWLTSMGSPMPRRIAWRDIRTWAEVHGLAPDEEGDLHLLVAEMEQEFAAIEA